MFRAAASEMRLAAIGFPVDRSSADEYRRAFEEGMRQQPDGLIVGDSAELYANRELIIELTRSHHLPALFPLRDYVTAGGMMVYAPDQREQFRHLAEQARQILGGARPADIPVYQASKFALLINLKAAQAQGFVFSPSLLARADEVIE
jgi:putative ABC transport system substrate-binding protein